MRRKQAEKRNELHLQRLEALHEIGQAVTSTLDLKAVLQVLMEKIDAFLPYSAVHIWLMNQESGALERAACWNVDEAEWKGRPLSDTPALVKEALASRAPVIARNVQTDPRTLDPEYYRGQGFVSYLGAPLVVKAEVLGVLVCLTRKERHFANSDIDFLSALAGQAAIAIHNSQLYEQTRNQAVELKKSNKAKDALLKEMEQQEEEMARLYAGLKDRNKELLVLRSIGETILGSLEISNWFSSISWSRRCSVVLLISAIFVCSILPVTGLSWRSRGGIEIRKTF